MEVGQGSLLPCLSLDHETFRLRDLAALSVVLDGWSLSRFPAWSDSKMGQGLLGIGLDKARDIERAEGHQSPRPCIWLYLRSLRSLGWPRLLGEGACMG